jgi:hypothetical protein
MNIYVFSIACTEMKDTSGLSVAQLQLHSIANCLVSDGYIFRPTTKHQSMPLMFHMCYLIIIRNVEVETQGTLLN